MEDTQAVNWDVEEEEEAEQSSEFPGYSLEPAGWLRIFSGAHGPEKDFPLHLGKNVVGRMPDCSVALPFPSISKQHAVIEILAWNKAPVLRDCGSLNGTQILRPPKVLSPGVSHRLRDQELILFADLPCQYHRLDVPLPFVSRGPLTVEETPRAQEGNQLQRLPLAEDSEEEIDSLSETDMMKESRTTSSPLSMVVPDSDEEGPSLSPCDHGPPFVFSLDSDTDEEEGQQQVTGEVSFTARRGATAEAEQPAADGVTTQIQLEKDHPSVKERNNDTKIERDAGNGVVPVILKRSQPSGEDSDTDVEDESRPHGRPAEVHLERAQPCGIIDSDTDVEEEGILATPALFPVKKRQMFHGVGTRGARAPELAHLQESQAGSDTDVEKSEAPQAIPLEKSQASMVINSDTDDEEEVSAALTLARLKESQAIIWNRDTDVEDNGAQPVIFVEQSRTSSGRDSDTDVEEEGLPVEKRETIPEGHTEKDGAHVIAHSEENQLPLGDSDTDVEADKISLGIHLERSQASSSVDINTEVEEEGPSGPYVVHLEKHQVSVEGIYETDVETERWAAKLPMVPLEEAQPPLNEAYETDAEEGTSLAGSAVADVRKSQLPVEGDAGTEWAAVVPEWERALEVGTQGGSPVAQVEQDLIPISRENLTDLVVDTDTPKEPTQPYREGPRTPTGRERERHMGIAKDFEDNHDVQSMEDEPTQAFLFIPPQEPDPSCCSFQASDEPWEVLATQPFCLRESEASDIQPIASHLKAHGSCLSSLRTTPQDQHPKSSDHTEPLEIHDNGMQIVDKDMSIPKETAERVTIERGPLKRKTKKLPPRGERDVTRDEESTRGIQGREQKLLARDAQRQEFDKKKKSTSPERDKESLKVETETSKKIQEKEIEKQTLTRETFEREVEQPIPEGECEPNESEVRVLTMMLGRGTQRRGPERGSQGQKGQASCPPAEPGMGAGDLQRPASASAPVASGSQSSGGRGVQVSLRRQQRGHLNCKMPPTEKTSSGDQESRDACLPPAETEALAPPQGSLVSQTQKHLAPQSLFSPFLPSLEPFIPKTRQKESQEAPETPLSSEVEPFHPKPKVRSRGLSRMTRSPVSSTPPEPYPTTPTDQPVTLEPTSRATRSRTNRSAVKNPDPVVPSASELQSSTFTSQPVTTKPITRATGGRTNTSSVKMPDPIVPTVPELHPSSSTDQAVNPKSISCATWGKTNRSSVKTSEPIIPTAPELQHSTSTDQSVTPKHTSRVTRGKANRSSVKTPEPIVHTAPELQPSTSIDQPVTPKPTSRATRGSTNRSSVNTPKSVVPIVPELQPITSTTQLVTSKPTSQVIRGKTNRFSVNIPEPFVPTSPEVQPSTSTEQPINPKPTFQATQSRTNRSSVKTPEPVVSTASELQSSTSTDQPVTPKHTSRVTRSRANRSSVKYSDPIVPIVPELQTSITTDQPVNLEHIPQTTRGRTNKSSVKTPEPIVPTPPELQPSTSTAQPVNPKHISRTTRGKTNRSSVKTPEPIVPTPPELQPSTSTAQPITPKPTSQATRGRTNTFSVKTPESVEPTTCDLEPPTPTDQPVTPKVIVEGSQSRTLRSSTISALPFLTTPEFQPSVTTGQPVPPEPVPQASCRRQRAAGKHGSLTSPIVYKPCSTSPEPKSQSSGNQRWGAVRAAESLTTIPEPAFPQLLEVPQIQEVEPTDRSGFTPEPQLKVSQSRKRALASSPPLPKRPQRGEVTQKTAFLKEEAEGTTEKPGKEEDVIPAPGKRKRHQAEEDPKEIPSRSLRRTKPNQESTAPKVLFTGVVDARGERAVLALGGSLASSVAEASHLVTDRIRRTVKFLCALGRGIPILSLDWLHQSRKAGCFLTPDEYLVADLEQEKNFGFSLQDALSRSRERRLLEGYEIHVTPGVQPPPPQMGEIISCCGGTFLPSMPRSYKPKRVVITCPQDFPRCSIPLRVGLPLLSPEFLLTGVLKQEAKPEAFVLSTLEMSST
ncbi:mediator of DNA damage checkpoint protein 1 isoform X2 [Nycticebus coucang]|uniref:mediator of DNA damage checkpoint protein 1 isoform X2 n=1 Tax=Nycticebus coucang TaxID=9470 RepID=UPI00234C0792|nr:mediator of DNA damage checkpoint protein 1 isoform X2 [Nycticebus coucang]